MKHSELQNEAIFAAIAIAVASLTLSQFDLFEWWYHYTRTHEAWQLDEFSVYLFVALLVGASLAVRHVFLLKKLTYALAEANERILEQNMLQARQEKLAALGELSSGMAHEISNALQPALGLGPFLRKELVERGDPKYLEYLDLILNSAYHMHGIIENVLAYTRDKSTELTRYEAFETIAEALHFSISILPSTLVFDIQEPGQRDKAPLYIDCNKTGLIQIFANILKNGADAMDGEGTITVAIIETTMPDAQQRPALCVRISDSGCGMEPAIVEKIFNPFFTTKDMSTGTGLGLSVVQGLTRQHGGRITVQSTVGVGSTFNVYLPLVSAGA